MTRSRFNWFHHLAVGAIALAFAYFVSGTAFVHSGLQFVGPALIIVLLHLTVVSFHRRDAPRIGDAVLARSLVTACLTFFGLLAVEAFTPMPAAAQVGNGDQLGVLIVCVVIIAFVVLVVIGLLYLFYKSVKFAWNKLFGKDDDIHDRFSDLGTLGVVVTVLIAMSLEGVPQGYRFDGRSAAQSSAVIAQPPEVVWQTMQTSTSAEFPIPNILRNFPRPVEVAIDEGTVLGANRVVRFEGREGAGEMSLRVVEQSETHATFKVLSDTSPIADWIGFEDITYRVVPVAGGSELTVSLRFERKLAPAIVFEPMMRGASKLAMGVLAQDVKERAEAARDG